MKICMMITKYDLIYGFDPGHEMIEVTMTQLVSVDQPGHTLRPAELGVS